MIEMKRQFRQMDDATKLRISQRLKGRSMSDSHKQAISDGMKAYWAGIPNKPTKNNENKNDVSNETSM
ncbi:MAG: hypothetical protein IJA95_10315 [Bacteroidaceae bacterium]|nr:hypothetical protein [Bacteroides sp.]MBQ4589662.1 hypothetical protein [Bacteroidaceae bacterium]